jgi:DNA topoisomerase-2
MWVVDDSGIEGPKIVKKEITYVPGLYKIFDEILGKKIFLNYSKSIIFIHSVNAADNKQRDKSMTLIEVDINQYVHKRSENLFLNIHLFVEKKVK